MVLVVDPVRSLGSRNPSERRIIGAMKRDVGAELEVEITAPTELEFQIAVAPHPNTEVSESLSFVLDGKTVQAFKSRIRAVQQAAGVTGNDVLIAVVAGVLREWLTARAELPNSSVA